MADSSEVVPVTPSAVWIVWSVVYSVGAVVGLVFFAARGIQNGKQPIAARQPKFVMVGALVGIGWTVLLCCHRVYFDVYPCWLTLWTGYCGAISLFNVYLARAFFLYMNFNVTSDLVFERQSTQARLERAPTTVRIDAGVVPPMKAAASTALIATRNGSLQNGDRTNNNEADDSCLTRVRRVQKRVNRRFMRRKYYLTLVGAVTVIMLIVPAAFTGAVREIREIPGDGCLTKWRGAASALAFFAGGYTLMYLILGAGLYGKYDAFGIKKELMWTAGLALVCIPVWYILNNVKSIALDFNIRTSLSTYVLLAMVLIAYVLAVLLPLIRSRNFDEEDAVINVEAPETIDTCKKLLTTLKGKEAFQTYLEGEFAVQHLFFYEDVEELESRVEVYKKEGFNSQRWDKIVSIIKDFHKHYIVEESLSTINVGKKLKRPLIDLHQELSEDSSLPEDDMEERIQEILTLYVDAKGDVFRMLRGSYRRFKRSEEFTDLKKSMAAELRVLETIHGNSNGMVRSS